MPRISIVIPFYNQKEALRQALDSISKQTVQDIEIVIVDDGSNPRLAVDECAHGMGISMPLLIRQENKGASAARNRGLRESKAEYVIFWDADVTAEPTMIEKMAKVLEEDADVSFVYSNFYFGQKKMPARSFDLTTLRRLNYISSMSLIRRSRAIQWDESLKRFQDWDLWLTMAEQGKKGMWIDEYLFRAVPRGTMSAWLPSFVYQKPWKWLPGLGRRVTEYEEAKAVIGKKHDL